MKKSYLKVLFLLFLLVLLSSVLHSQKDNALPLGPARINGKVFIENQTQADVEVILLYERDGIAQKQVFKTSKDGYFTIYVYSGIENPLICVIYNNAVRFVYIPENVIEGVNYFKDFIIDTQQKIKIEDKRYRNLLKD